MDITRSRIIMYALLGGAAQAATALFYGERSELLLSALLPALIAIALLARIGLKQLDAAHNLSTQLGRMIEHKDMRFLIVPAPGCPEMSAIGHQLNVLIYAMASATEPATDDRHQRTTPDAGFSREASLAEASSYRLAQSLAEAGSRQIPHPCQLPHASGSFGAAPEPLPVGARFTAR